MSLLGTSSPPETASTLAGVRLEMKSPVSGVTKIQRHATRHPDGLRGLCAGVMTLLLVCALSCGEDNDDLEPSFRV